MARVPSLAAMALVLAQATAAAQEPSYQALIDEAIDQFDDARFAEARVLFERAHAIAPSARTLRGIGMASFELGDWIAAHRALSAALADPRRPLDASQADDARALIARASRFLGRYRVVSEPEGAALELDGRPAVIEPEGSILVPLGEHLLIARAEGHRDASATLFVHGGEDEELRLELPAEIEEPIALEAPAEVLPSRALPAPSLPPSTDPVLAITLLASGGAIATAALVSGLTWWLAMDQEVSACARAGSACRNAGEVTDRRDLAAGTTTGLALLGTAALVAGALTMWTQAPSGAHACLIWPGGLSCSASF